MEDVPAITTFTRREFDESKSPELTLFKYTPNSRGFIFLQICSALLFIIAFTVYLITRFEPLYWMLPSLGLAGSGVYLIYLALYWSWFARRSGVGFDESFLYIVRTKSVDRVAWRHLSAEAAGFTETHDNGDHGTLNMTIEGKKIQLKLFNPFVWVDDFPTFLVEMLSQIKSNENSQPGMAESRANPEGCEQDASNNSQPGMAESRANPEGCEQDASNNSQPGMAESRANPEGCEQDASNSPKPSTEEAES